MYANNSVIDINLVGNGSNRGGGILECYTDDTTCCRGIDNPNGTGRGEWYYPNGTVVPPPGGSSSFYRIRKHMIITLYQNIGMIGPTGAYRCEIPGAEGVTIIRYITLSNTGGKSIKLML